VFLGGDCGVFGDSCGSPEPPGRDAGEAPEVVRVLAEVQPSADAAAKKAGIVKVPPALEVAQKVYRKLSPKERAAFLERVKQQ
jgi:hypothetical protein